MAQECGFFNAQLVGEDEYDRVYLAEQFAAYFASFIGNGVFGKSMQKLEVLAQNSPNMSVKVLSGEAWINGWWYRNTEEYTLPLDVADGVLNRIDAIVLRWGNQERDMWLQVIKGVASSNPVVPSIKRDADYYDLQLATVAVSKGAIKITQSSIKDTRLDNSVCGLVTGVVDQIDTTGLYNQFEQYFEEFKEHYEGDFADWVAKQKAAYDAWVKGQQDAYVEYITTQQQLYLDFVTQKQADYNLWVQQQKDAYDAYITKQKADYDSYIANLKADYDKYTTGKKAEWETWSNEQKEAFIEFVNTSTNAYNDWISQQEQAFNLWYSIHTQQWEQDFNTWFESVKNKLSGDIATNLQNQIDELEALQPTTSIGMIKHNKNKYVQAHLYETTYACGVQGAGEGPAGGGSLTSIPLEYTMPDKNTVFFKTKAGYGTLSELISLSDDMHVSLFLQKITSLVLIIS